MFYFENIALRPTGIRSVKFCLCADDYVFVWYASEEQRLKRWDEIICVTTSSQVFILESVI